MDEYDDNDYNNLVYFKDIINLEKEKLQLKYREIYYLIIDGFDNFDKQKQKLTQQNWDNLHNQVEQLEQKIVWLKELIKLKYRYCNDDNLKRFWGIVEDQ